MTLVRKVAGAEGRDLTGWRCIINAHAPEDIVPLLRQLQELGATDVVVDLDYDAADGPQQAFQTLSTGAA